MRSLFHAWAVGIVLAGSIADPAQAAGPISFRSQTIDAEIGKVCYALVTADVDSDGKLDVVAVANDAVVWYQNPTWIKRDILRGTTEPDNVCLQPHDVDGDGRVDFAVGSAWRPTDTTTGGALSIVTRTGAPEGTWRAVPITSEPTLHRVRWGDVLGVGRPQLVVAPLQGRGTRGPDWAQGSGSRIMAVSIPEHPFDDPWPIELVSDRLHAVHNLQIVDARPLDPSVSKARSILAASWEGVFLIDRSFDEAWRTSKLGSGNQETRPNRGASEVKLGRLRDGRAFVATIEPWHGSQFVVYHGELEPGSPEKARHVVAEEINWGHAVWCADLDGDGDDEVIVGQRDPNPKADASRRGPGVMIFEPKPGSDPIAFDRRWVDDGGIAVEDLVVADLDGDGRLDIIAGGRASHNVKIYWNEAKARP